MTTKIGSRILLALILLSSEVSLWNFDLILTDIKCTARNDYVSHVSCFVNKSQPEKTRVSVSARLLKELKVLRADVTIELLRRKGDTITLFKEDNLDACSLGLYENVTLPVFKMYKDILLKYGNWPRKCPVPVGFECRLLDVHLEPDNLPSFLPETNFKVHASLSNGKIAFFVVDTFGKISHRKKSKNNGKK